MEGLQYNRMIEEPLFELRQVQVLAWPLSLHGQKDAPLGLFSHLSKEDISKTCLKVALRIELR